LVGVRQLPNHYQKQYNNNYQKYLQIKTPHFLVNQTKFCYISGSHKTNQLGKQMKHLLIILSILLLTSNF
jgi:hypothetical protein